MRRAPRSIPCCGDVTDAQSGDLPPERVLALVALSALLLEDNNLRIPSLLLYHALHLANTSMPLSTQVE